MEQSPMKQSSLKLVEPTVVVPMPTVAEETPVTVSPPKSPSKPQKVTVRTPWSARNQLLRDHASFDYSFRSALNLMLARDAGETVRLWREMPGKARRVALHRMRATCIEYWPTARDCSLLAPGLAHVKRMLERAVDSKRCTDILDRLQRICDRSMGALREVTRELGAVVDADSTAAAFLADSEQLLSDHIDQLAVLAHFHREQHLRLLLSFQRTVERMLQTAVIIPRKRVGDDKARLRACALEKLSYALMNLVQSYTKRRVMCGGSGY